MTKSTHRDDTAALVAAFVAAPNEALIKGTAVYAVTWLSESTRDRQIKAGTFPAPLHFGSRCKRWQVGAIRAWLVAQSAGAGQWAPPTSTTGAARPVAGGPANADPMKRGPGRPRKVPASRGPAGAAA